MNNQNLFPVKLNILNQNVPIATMYPPSFEFPIRVKSSILWIKKTW